MFLYVFVENVEDDLKLFNKTHIFETEYVGESLLRPQRIVAKF